VAVWVTFTSKLPSIETYDEIAAGMAAVQSSALSKHEVIAQLASSEFVKIAEFVYIVVEVADESKA